MQNIDILKRARAPKRAIFTRLSTEFWTEIEKPDFDTEKYRAKYNRICALSKEISEIDSRYHGLLLEDETTTEVKIEEEFEGCENYVQGMFDKENKYLSRCETAKVRVDGSLVESAANSVVNTESKRTIRLPKVELPKYKGNLEDWLSWWGQFSKINDDETLGDVDKFHYLLQAVVEGSRAYRLVCSYPITEDNYPKVVQALKDRFGDKNLLIEHYIRRLLKLVGSNARKENLPLDEIYDDLTAHLKNLESLGVNTEMAGVFLYPLVESSLPLDIIQVWQRNPAAGYGIKEEGAENGDKSDASGRLQALMDFLRDEVKGAERMAFAKENFEGNSSMRATGSQLKTPRKTPPTVSNLFGSEFKRKCIFCQRDNHLSSECFVASHLTPSERGQKIKEARVCFKCLKGNHLKGECRADIKCRNCGKDHLDIFCNKIALRQGENNSFKGEKSKVVNEGNATCTGVNMSARTCANDILLMTSVAKLKGAKETKEVKVLFDTGSHYSYIKRSIVEKLGLNKIGEISLEKSLFGGGNMKEALHGKYVLKLGSLTNKIDVDIVALDQPEICARIPPIPRGQIEEIDILIGSDYFGQLLTGKVVHLGEDLTAVETKLGWTLMGQSPVVCKEDKVQIALNMLVARNNLKDLWELDVLGIQDPIEVVSKNKRETELKEHFIKNIKRNEDKRYSVALPWKCERNNIPSNLEIAQRRLEACTSKLRKEKMVKDYSNILQEWEREGLIERIEENRPQKKGHYLPHRPVFKAESRTTPLRPVFDASCRSYNGLSLNDYLEKRPNLLEKIPGLLIRFREKGIGVLFDIRKAFQMIRVQLQDQDFLRFLWWDQTDPMKLTVFRHKRVVFGLNCSPFILGAVIDHHLNSVQGPAAEIAKTMARSFYMDNLVTSLSSQEEVQQFQNTAVNIMEMAKMDLREWKFNLPVSNSKEEKGTTTKVLGLVWDKVEDVLNCDVSIEKDLPRRLTKRIILSKIQQVFDPLGVYSPIFLPPKLLLQRSWELKIGWDSQLPEDMDREFRTWYSQIGLLSQIKIPRHIWFDQTNKNEIHVFCDASKSAYAAVAYMRKLLACVLGARLVKSISTALTNSCPVTLWTDSSTVMAWLKRKNEWNVFVRNRVQEIRDTVNNENWKFVYGKFNPADLPSRGCSIVQFVSTNWWEGPEWLKGEKESWPSFEPTIDEEEIIKEKRKTLQAHITLIVEANRWFLDRRSKYSLNIRIMAWVLRFLDNARRIPTEKGNLKVIELERAERKLLKLVQQETFPGKQAPKNGLKTIKSVEGLWRHNQKPIQTPGAALPTNRIGLGKPFKVTGVDLLGPLHLKGGSKVWVALFTCAVYRAVHLEIVRTLEANTFLLALKRFICRRGRPGKIYSDNGTNFSKTNELLKRLDWGEIERESSVKRIQWIFIPPSAPWWGGFWERLVRVVKSLLVCMLGFSKLNYVQLETALCEVESIINNRALSYISEDDQDLIPLTPQIFLQTNANNEFPELEKIRVNSFTRKYKILSKLNEELKQRFRKEYLGVLMQRAENKRERCIKEGDLVLIGQDNTKRILWPVGKIIKLYLGKDGVNRVARVKTSTGEWLRPVQRLFPLEISSEETPEKVSGDKKPLTIKTRFGREVRKPISRPPAGWTVELPTNQSEGHWGQKGQGAGARVGVTALPTRQEKILAGACPRGALGSSSIFHKRPYKRSEKLTSQRKNETQKWPSHLQLSPINEVSQSLNSQTYKSRTKGAATTARIDVNSVEYRKEVETFIKQGLYYEECNSKLVVHSCYLVTNPELSQQFQNKKQDMLDAVRKEKELVESFAFYNARDYRELKMNDSNFTFPKLNAFNYNIWKVDMKVLLIDRGSWDFIIEDEHDLPAEATAKDIREFKWRKDRAFTTIYQGVERKYQTLIANAADGKEAWNILKQNFEPNSRARLAGLIDKFYELKFTPDEETIGIFIKRLIRKLPQDYDGIVQVLYRLEEKQFNVENIEAHLITESGIVQQKKKDDGLDIVANAYQTKTHRMYQGNKKKNYFSAKAQYSSGSMLESTVHPRTARTHDIRNCSFCGKTGHLLKDCFLRNKNSQWQHYRKEQNYKGKSSAFHSEILSFHHICERASDPTSEWGEWLIDSAATSNFCKEKDWFVNYQDIPRWTL
ncbi:hypothetical protein LAZ67_2002562 [Cordylochernes scorpioides]|uniref:Uncharacterized protein n=1 Tax=Cordylochernes scorpioides TaxID=51811 RepID=A0ABY6K5K9_9ARAC|nr:hypothetical protein LAZ67_2002562 [Cordylochernes scorpioides]